MRLLLIYCILVFFSEQVYSQSWDKFTSQASVYYNKEDYNQAILAAEKGIKIARDLFGEEDSNYATAINILGMIYHRVGKEDSAEQILLQAISIRKKTLRKDHPLYANSLINLAYLYVARGDYQKALNYYKEALDIYRATRGVDDPNFASCLNHLGMVYAKYEMYDLAERFFRAALRIRKKNFGINSAEYAEALNNMGGIFMKTARYDSAEIVFTVAGNIEKQIFGIDSRQFAGTLRNVGFMYVYWRNYKKAQSLLLKSLDIFRHLPGDESNSIAELLIVISLLESYQKNFYKAEQLMRKSYDIVLKNTVREFEFLSDQEKGNLLLMNNFYFNFINSYLFERGKPKPLLGNYVFNNLLRLKSLSLSDTRNMLESVRSSNDKTVQSLLTKWSANKAFLARQYLLPPRKRVKEIKEIEEQAEHAEKELNRLSGEFRNQQSAIRISVRDVQKNLQPDEVAIEFVSFHVYNKKWTDSTMYAAYVLQKNDSVPVFIPLFEEKQLEILFDSAGKSVSSMVNSFYRGLKINNSNTASLGKELYKLVWQPLEPYLKNIKKVSYSPAGKLFNIAFQALPVDSSNLLMDKYHLFQYTSTRQVALRSAELQAAKPGSILLFGNPSFTMDSLQLARNHGTRPPSAVSSSRYTPPARGAGPTVRSWPDLQGTAEEVRKVKKLFDQNKIETKLFTQASASEENLKALSGHSPQILHIATHGFFLQKSDTIKTQNSFESGNSYRFADDPLLRSGLILAGGNYAWTGNTPVEAVEDGIVTAYEISQLNLSHTGLVVLSACETALGDIRGREGVFGLQRAFKMAGVKKMIVSLWQVPDQETAELMTTFYSYLMQGKNITDSFLQAQTDMRRKYSPYYWAAFVLID